MENFKYIKSWPYRALSAIAVRTLLQKHAEEFVTGCGLNLIVTVVWNELEVLKKTPLLGFQNARGGFGRCPCELRPAMGHGADGR